MNKRFIRMHDDDSVATALEAATVGDTASVFDKNNVEVQEEPVLETIPHGNKIALQDITPGDKVIKYGAVIGECTRPVRAGRLVHVHNVKSLKLDVPSEIRKAIIRQMEIDCGEDQNG